MRAKYRILAHPGGFYEVQERWFVFFWVSIELVGSFKKAEDIVQRYAEPVYLKASYDKNGNEIT